MAISFSLRQRNNILVEAMSMYLTRAEFSPNMYKVDCPACATFRAVESKSQFKC